MTVNRYIVITCAILHREICHCVAKSKNIVDIILQEKGLHDLQSEKMSGILQEVIDNIDCSRYDALLLGYGLCNNGLVNLHAPIPMVLPRAHDCITLLMGTKESYDKYFAENPGTYFKSSGWLERNFSEREDSIAQQLGMYKSYEGLVEEFGEDNADYLQSILGNWMSNYKKLAFINNGIGNVEGNRMTSQAYAEEKNWEYEEVQGDNRLIEKLIDGDWDEQEFLVVPPGSKIVASHDGGVVKFEH